MIWWRWIIRLLNEKNEILAILDGKRIDKRYTYRSCYLLAKYYKSLGYDFYQTRKEIFYWANKYGIFITDDLNSIINRAYKDKSELIDDTSISISKGDIFEIVDRFDKYNTRLVAFAILCFAKVNANYNGEFQLSLIGLSNWVGINRGNIAGRILKELINFGFIKKIEKGKFTHIRQKNHPINTPITFKLLIPLDNSEDYVFYDEDIRDEFQKILSYYGLNTM